VTVLQGARAIGGMRVNPRVQPQRGAKRIAVPNRRRLSSPTRAGRRTQPFAALIAAVLVALLIGLIYVAQTIRLAAISYEVDGLIAERDDIARQIQTLETSVLSWGTEATVLDNAQRLGLDQIQTRVRLPAR
jgi:hypothetical protein